MDTMNIKASCWPRAPEPTEVHKPAHWLHVRLPTRRKARPFWPDTHNLTARERWKLS